MRKKIAMRWRRKALRMGAIIHSEKPCMSKKELRKEGLTATEAGFGIEMEYKGQKYTIAANTMLDAYKLMVWVIEDLDEWGEHTVAILLDDGSSVMRGLRPSKQDSASMQS